MEIKHFRKKLKNGMTIILEKRNLPIVSVGFAVRYGGINEAAEERGIAHFIEHMLYKGTKKRNYKQISSEIEKNGGELNGFTDEDVTAFWCKMPSKHLDIALNVLSDMVKNPKMDEKEMVKERKVILEEMKIHHDDPTHYVFEKIQELLYNEPLGIPLIGTPETIGSITRKKLMERFDKAYNPNNLILCVVGDADFDRLVSFTEKNFEGKGSFPEKQKISLRNGQKIEKRKGIDQAKLILAFHSPLTQDKKVYAAELLMVLLGEGLSSRLFQEIREKRNLVYEILGDLCESKLYSYSYIYAGCLKENLGLVKKLILEEFEKVSKTLTEKELNLIKEQAIGAYYLGMENSRKQMQVLIMNEVDDNLEEFYNYEKHIRNVKLSDVKDIAAGVKKGYSFFALVPED